MFDNFLWSSCGSEMSEARLETWKQRGLRHSQGVWTCFWIIELGVLTASKLTFWCVCWLYIYTCIIVYIETKRNSLNCEHPTAKHQSSCPPYWSILASPPSSLLAKDPPSIVAKNVFCMGRHHKRGVFVEGSRQYLKHNTARSAKQTTNMHQFNMTFGPAAMSELCGSFENLAVYLSFQCQSQMETCSLINRWETIRNWLLLLKPLTWPYNVAAMHMCQDFLYGNLLP